MAQFYAYTAFNIDYLDLNWYLTTYQSEIMMPSVIPGYQDNYVIYNSHDEALAMAGNGFAYDMFGYATIGTIGALGEAFMDTDGYWWDYFWVEGLNLSMSDMFDAIVSASNADDLALVREQLAGNDRMYLSPYDDFMKGFKGNDNMYGYAGRDILDGGKGNDKLFGGSGKDTLKGGSGDDIIRGGKGRDIEIGGKGEDTFLFKTGDDKSIIKDFDARGASHDVIDLSGLKSVRNWSDLRNNHMEKDGGNVVIDGGNGDVIVIRDVTLNSLDKGDFLF